MEVGFGAPHACYVCGAPVIVWVRHWRHGTEERRVLDQDGAQGHHACPPAAWEAYYARREAVLPTEPWAFPDHLPEPSAPVAPRTPPAPQAAPARRYIDV